MTVAMVAVLLLASVQIARVQHKAGDVIEVDAPTARDMIAKKYAVEPPAPSVAPAPAGPSHAEEFFGHLNATEAIAHIGMVRSRELLYKLAEVEQARPRGARKSVADAFTARFAALDRGDGDSGKTEPTSGEGIE